MSRAQKELGPQLFLLAAGKRQKVTENCTVCGQGQLQKQLSQARLTNVDPNSLCRLVVLSVVMTPVKIYYEYVLVRHALGVLLLALACD